MDIDTRMLKITPGILIFGNLLLHWLIANKSRKFQNALSAPSFGWRAPGAKLALRFSAIE
ncbi:MAG TPA: hypothetical protein DHV57_00985 [Hyphomonas sp.]|nr:hypothetical protein [Hyphomonas sp.]HCJ15973.1 hypothetical protein [Hyphomonas sp.]